MFQTQHDVLPQETHDEFARAEFCGTLRKFFTETLWPGAADVYKGKQLPTFVRRNGREPANRQEVKALMEETFYFRASNLMGRCAQELLWDTVGETVERQLPELIEKAKPKANPVGSLKLNPDLPIPRYIQSVDIHVMPGNFHTELGEDDVYAGALYDRGVYYFAFGGMGPENDKLGVAMADYVKTNVADLHPKRILDMGSGMGFSTLPWKTLYPDAEVYGVDIAAPMMRYAHARAESFGVPIHFSQQDATHTDFPDGHFDVVLSCLVTHEMPVHVIKAMFKESYRLLAPGGLLMCDGGGKRTQTPDKELFTSWFSQNNNEPFTAGLNKMNLADAIVEAGFEPESIFYSGNQAPVYLKGMWKTEKTADGKVEGGYSGYLMARKS
jgi:ubiquinone/menaquinone biosynthesis C-methylase UbiE